MVFYKCCQNCPNVIHNGGSSVYACTLPCYEQYSTSPIYINLPIIINPITVPNYSSTGYPSWYYNSVTTTTTNSNTIYDYNYKIYK